MKDDIYILAVESSCDETAAAVVKNGREVLSDVIASQVLLHAEFGGVVPELASRKHIENIDNCITSAFSEAKISPEDISAVAVTYGPGLVGALLVGLSAAKAFAFAANKPLIGVNHIEGHVCANYIADKDFTPPYTALVVSGGHTHLLYVKDYREYKILGRTRDDAAGEAYDKIARALSMPYPGGPAVDKAAACGDPSAITFPRVYLEDGSFDFSFSGLKSAVLNYINSEKMQKREINVNNVAAAFQAAVVEVLVNKTIKAARLSGTKKIALSGGVASNSGLRAAMSAACEREGFSLNVPPPALCTDNAAMIGSAGYFKYINNDFSGWDLNANPNLRLE